MRKIVFGISALAIARGGKIESVEQSTANVGPGPGSSSTTQAITGDPRPREPLALGESCTGDSECASGLCNVAGTSRGFCTKPCADKSACGANFECIDWSFTGGYCFVTCPQSSMQCAAVPNARCIVYPRAEDGEPVSVCVQ